MNIHFIDGGICAPAGFTAAGIASGIKTNGNPDLALVVSGRPCSAAAVYTQNKVKAAPVLFTQRALQDGAAQGILCNSGNANACNPNGLQAAEECAQLAAKATGLGAQDFVIASTGVIGQELPLEPFRNAVPTLAAALSAGGAADAARAIMTTDTKRKEFAVELEIDGKKCRIGAMAKGSGMININMATMLTFLTTDVAITTNMLQQALSGVVQATLNQVCVDGDTSTNDMAALLANGQAGNNMIEAQGDAFTVFCTALERTCVEVAKSLAADGEGATKLLECDVTGAPDDTVARAVAKSVIASDLLKAAMFGGDANWGRVLCAIGYTPGDFPVDHISVVLESAAGSALVCKDSAHAPYSEEDAAKILAQDVIRIKVDMGSGGGSGTAWGCDLTYDYVKINGDYRS